MLKEEELSDWVDVAKCLLKTGMLRVVFRKVVFRVMEAIAVNRPQAATTEVIEVDKNRNDVTRELESSPGFTAVRDMFRHGTVRFVDGPVSARSRSRRACCHRPIWALDR